jgi:hypothetical protein
MTKMSKKNFKMNKIKLVPDGGGVYHESIITIDGEDGKIEVARQETVAITPHPDLSDIIKMLKNYVMTSCMLSSLGSVLYSKEFGLTEDQEEAYNAYLDLLRDKITITGIAVSGTDQTRGVIITSKIKAENGRVTALNTPIMRFSSAVYGFENDLEEICDTIETELYEFLFNNKHAQLEIPVMDMDNPAMGVMKEETISQNSAKQDDSDQEPTSELDDDGPENYRTMPDEE